MHNSITNTLKALFVLFLLASLPMCKGCTEEKTANLLEIVPQDAAFVAYLPSLKDALKDTTAYIETLSAPTGIDVIGKLRQGLKTRLGSDPLERESLVASGVDFEKGVVLFSLAKPDSALMGVAIRDKTSFNKSIKGYLARMDGADSVEMRDVAGFKVYLAGRPFGTEVVPVLHWTVFNGIALLATEESRAAFEEHLTYLSKQNQPETAPTHILLDPVYKELAAQVENKNGKGFSIFIRGSAAADQFNAGEGRDFSKGAMTHASIGIEGFSVETFIHTADSLEKALGKKAPIELVKQIEDDAIFLILTQSATPEAYTALKAHPVAKDLARRMLGPLGQAAGINPEKDVLPLLTGPMALSVHLGNIDKSLARFAKSKSFRSLLNIVHIVATAQISDSEAMLKTLRASQKSLTERKVMVEEKEIVVGDKKALRFSPPGARLGWGVIEDTYYYAVGEGRVENLLKGLQAPLEKPLKLGQDAQAAASTPGSTVIILRTGAIAEGLSKVELNDDKGAAMRLGALFTSGLQVLRTIGDITIKANAEAEGVRIKISSKNQIIKKD